MFSFACCLFWCAVKKLCTCSFTHRRLLCVSFADVHQLLERELGEPRSVHFHRRKSPRSHHRHSYRLRTTWPRSVSLLSGPDFVIYSSMQIVDRYRRQVPGYHFSGISGNQGIQLRSVKSRGKRQKVKSGSSNSLQILKTKLKYHLFLASFL